MRAGMLAYFEHFFFPFFFFFFFYYDSITIAFLLQSASACLTFFKITIYFSFVCFDNPWKTHWSFFPFSFLEA